MSTTEIGTRSSSDAPGTNMGGRLRQSGAMVELRAVAVGRSQDPDGTVGPEWSARKSQLLPGTQAVISAGPVPHVVYGT